MLFWIVLAGRQTLSIVDAYLHLGLASSIRAGTFPPAFPWHPDLPAPYHYGADMLIALLAPPFGPDMAFTTELFEAYAWTSLALIVATWLFNRGSWVPVLAACPLLLSFGLWTQLHNIPPPGIVQIPVVAGVPEAGLRASLGEIYWPFREVPLGRGRRRIAAECLEAPLCSGLWTRPRGAGASLLPSGSSGFRAPDIGPCWWRSSVSLTRSSLRLFWGCGPLGKRCHSSPAGDSSTPWTGVRWYEPPPDPRPQLCCLRWAGGPITDALFGSSPSGLSIGWVADAGGRRPVGVASGLPGGLGVLEAGVLPVCVAALLLAWRSRLTMSLAAAAGVLLLAALTVQYEFSLDVVRLDGHARNFALLALLDALGYRLGELRPRWRYAAGAALVALVTWPTAVTPVKEPGSGGDSRSAACERRG